MKNTIPALIITFLVLAGAALLLYKARTVAEGVGRIFPGLAEELAPEQVVLETTLTIQPGKVFELTPTSSGYMLQEKAGYRLVERLALNNVDLQPNDVVSWHGWDWWFSNAWVDYSEHSLTDITRFALWFNVTLDELNNDNVVFGRGTNWYSKDQIMFNFVHVYGKTELRLGNGTQVFSLLLSYDPPVGERIAVHAVLDNSGVYELYVNGQLIGSNDKFAGQTPASSTRPVVIGAGPNHERPIHGRLEYLAVTDYYATKPTEALLFLTDPTWYNGTHYFSVKGYVGTPNNVIRIPAEQTWLWLIKQLKTDNKLHFQWFPAGSIVRVIDANGFVREWTVSGNATVEGQVEDFAVSVDFDVLPNASIEAIVPSLKARFYVPQGFTVKLEAADGTAYSAVSSGYADIAVPEGEYTVKIIASSIETKDYTIEWSRYGSSLEIKVYDQGFPVTHALVIVKDTVANEVLAYGETDASGSVEFSEINAAAVEVEVHKLQDGIYYHDSETIQLTTQITASPSPMSTTAADNRRALYIAVGVFVIALIAVIVAIARRR